MINIILNVDINRYRNYLTILSFAFEIASSFKLLCFIEYTKYIITSIVIQIQKYNHVLNGKFTIKNIQLAIEMIGNIGTNGTIKLRFKFG